MAKIFVFGSNGEIAGLGDPPRNPEKAVILNFVNPSFSGYLVDFLIAFVNEDTRYDAVGFTNLDQSSKSKLLDLEFDTSPDGELVYLPSLYAAMLLESEFKKGGFDV